MGSLGALLVLIGPLIFVHELGHLLAAKLVDVKAVRFSIGFGPPLLRRQIGETEWCLAPIPLGGYVSLLGQAPGIPVPPDEADRSLAAKPLWARYLVLAAGPLANFVLPVILYFFFFLGQATVTPPVIGTVVDDSAAAAAGLQQGDRIVAVEGEDVASWSDMARRVARAPGQELRIQLVRDGKRFDRFVTPRKVSITDATGERHEVGRLGITAVFYAPQVGILDPRSAAAREGLRTGDVVTSVNGEPLRTVEDLQRLLADLRGDAQIRLTYLRARPQRGPIATFLWYDSHHAQILPRKDAGFETGILPANTFVRTVAPGSPADEAGIRPGDRVLQVQGQPFARWEYLAERLQQAGEEPVELLVQSPGARPRAVTVRQRIVTFRDVYRHDRRMLLFGAEPYAKTFRMPAEPIRGRFTHAARAALSSTWDLVGQIGTVLRQMLTFRRGVEEIGSVIGMATLAETAAERGPTEFMLLMALLSINLGIINLLPIPILDGGHLLFFTIEAIRRRPLEQRAREVASAIGLAVLLVLMLIAARNDIMRYWMDP